MTFRIHSYARRLIGPQHVRASLPMIIDSSSRRSITINYCKTRFFHHTTHSQPTTSSIMMLSSSNATNIINYTQRQHYSTTCRLLSSATNYTEDIISPTTKEDGDGARGQRVWKARQNNIDDERKEQQHVHAPQVYHWNRAVDDVQDRRVVDESLSRICEQVCLSPPECHILLFITFALYIIEAILMSSPGLNL